MQSLMKERRQDNNIIMCVNNLYILIYINYISYETNLHFYNNISTLLTTS